MIPERLGVIVLRRETFELRSRSEIAACTLLEEVFRQRADRSKPLETGGEGPTGEAEPEL